VNDFLSPSLPPCSRQRLSYDDCLEDERLSELFFAVLRTSIVHSDMHVHLKVLTGKCWLRFVLSLLN